MGGIMEKFGYELEFCGASIDRLVQEYELDFLRKKDDIVYDRFHLKDEEFVTTKKEIQGKMFFFGGELITPIFTDYQKCLKQTKYYLQALKEQGAYLEDNANNTGFHIHLDKTFLDTHEKKQNLLQFLYAFQPEIYFLAQGDYEKIRENYIINAQPLTYRFVKEAINRFDCFTKLHSKYHCIRETKETIEFRYFNSSLELETIKKYLDFVLQVRNFIQDKDSDFEQINFYYRHAKNDLSFSEAKLKVMKRILNL